MNMSTKDQPQRLPFLLGALVVMIIAAAIAIFRSGRDPKPPPSYDGYYVGTKKSKGDPTVFSDEDSRRMPAPKEALEPGKANSAGPDHDATPDENEPQPETKRAAPE